MKKIGDPLRNDFGSPGTISQKTGLKIIKILFRYIYIKNTLRVCVCEAQSMTVSFLNDTLRVCVCVYQIILTVILKLGL